MRRVDDWSREFGGRGLESSLEWRIRLKLMIAAVRCATAMAGAAFVFYLTALAIRDVLRQRRRRSMARQADMPVVPLK